MRGNATVERVDSLPFYVLSGDNIVKLKLNAPGSHYLAK